MLLNTALQKTGANCQQFEQKLNQTTNDIKDIQTKKTSKTRDMNNKIQKGTNFRSV